MADGYCPECDGKINLGPQPEEGRKVTCPRCGAYLMIVSTAPIELDWAYDDDDEYVTYGEYEDEGYED
jgi:lysine biosynthesis protein LysW